MNEELAFFAFKWRFLLYGASSDVKGHGFLPLSHFCIRKDLTGHSPSAGEKQSAPTNTFLSTKAECAVPIFHRFFALLRCWLRMNSV